jgi:hypothetical protein
LTYVGETVAPFIFKKFGGDRQNLEAFLHSGRLEMLRGTERLANADSPDRNEERVRIATGPRLAVLASHDLLEFDRLRRI